MTRPQEPPVAITLRLYRALASAFPHEFKNAYGQELVQVTEDAIEPIWRRHGVLGLVRLLVDIAIRVPAEHFAELQQDIRYGLRMLAGSPGFTAVALISLSLGIAAATSFFSELNATMLRSVPGVSKPGELVTLQAPTSYPYYRRLRERSDLFSSTLAYVAPVPFGVSLGGRTERTWEHLVTPSYFSALGVRPALGRVFDEEQEQPGAAPTVVVSHRFWHGRLGADPSVIGKTMRINGYPCAVIGVGPKEFLGASPMMFAADLWLPLSVGGRVAPELADNALEQRNLTMFQVVGRLKPGITAVRAEAELDTVARQLEQDHGDADRAQKGRRVLLKAGGKLVPTRKQNLPLVMALPIVVLVLILLIACSNVANMMLARAADRRREIAVRLALGASRARLIRQLLTESMLVAAGAGMMGFVLTMWLMRLASRVNIPNPMPVNFNVEPDGRVLLFALVLTVLTGLAFGLVPALQATRADLTPALKEGGTVQLRRYRRLSLRNMLVLHQVAGSLMLLLLTGIVVIGYQRIMQTQVGFDPKNLYLISVDPVRDGYSGKQAAAFFQDLLDRVKRHPAVSAASLTDTVPTALSGRVTLSTAGPGAQESRTIRSAQRCVVGKDYFDTTGIPILLGRGFRSEDETNEAPAIIVNETLVHRFWPREDPLGRRIELGDPQVFRFHMFVDSYLDYRRGAPGKAGVFEVVGVAKDVKTGSGMERPRPAIYFPLRPADYAQPTMRGVTLMVRGRPGIDVIGAVRREISAMDSDLTAFNARRMEEQLDQLMFPVRAGVWCYGAMGVFGLILASVGLAGVTAYSVARRAGKLAFGSPWEPRPPTCSGWS